MDHNVKSENQILAEGGPAFPNDVDGGPAAGWEGMTLRDYFAAKSIAGYLPGPGVPDRVVREYAGLAYRVADAMIEARKNSS